jgi:hypothetical protein
MSRFFFFPQSRRAVSLDCEASPTTDFMICIALDL